ncbi:hypothetical protein BGZ83_010574, partial [Gryganskiella cystojenkinii]
MSKEEGSEEIVVASALLLVGPTEASTPEDTAPTTTVTSAPTTTVTSAPEGEEQEPQEVDQENTTTEAETVSPETMAWRALMNSTKTDKVTGRWYPIWYDDLATGFIDPSTPMDVSLNLGTTTRTMQFFTSGEPIIDTDPAGPVVQAG